MRSSFIVWAGDVIFFHINTTNTHSVTSPLGADTFIGVDGTMRAEITSSSPTNTTQIMPASLSGVLNGLSEGLHSARVYGAANVGGSATWNVGGAATQSLDLVGCGQ
jgi:hypothetical protein